jgi:hypothetical protein
MATEKVKKSERAWSPKRVFFRLLLPTLVAALLTYVLVWLNKPGELDFQAPNFLISDNITEATMIMTLSPSYFYSRAKFYVAMASPYIASFEKFSLNMSLDGINWSEIHPYTALPEPGNESAYTFLGYVDLGQMNIVIHVRYLIPP